MQLAEGRTYVGTLQATIYSNWKADIAHTVFPRFWQKGYAKEGCGRMLAHLFEDYHVELVRATMDIRNKASMHLVESLGFTRASTHQNADFFKGVSSHEYHYELQKFEAVIKQKAT